MFTKLNARFGAETSEIDLSKIQKDSTIELIKNEFLTHSALVFRKQNLDDNALVRFGKIFGELEEHLIENSDGKIMSPVHSITNYDSSGKPSSRPYINTNYFWHSDKSYLKKPSLATLLYPVILPLNGGDTQLAHMGLALEALPYNASGLVTTSLLTIRTSRNSSMGFDTLKEIFHRRLALQSNCLFQCDQTQSVYVCVCIG